MDLEPSSPPPPAAADRSTRRKRPKRRAREDAATEMAPPPPKRDFNPSEQPVPPPPPRARAAPKPRRKAARKKAPRPFATSQRKMEALPPPPPSPPPRPSLEEEIEAVLSRGPGTHVVPTFAGWFSWNKIHPIEKQTLATFFCRKSKKRTPDIYLGIRNFIMKKFHFNPRVHLESKDLSELSIGEMDARLEVLEFLAYWGLVNFHPLPPDGQGCMLVESKNNADTEERTSLVDKLFQFETVQSYLVPVPDKADIASPAQVSHLLCEPSLDKDAATSTESSVEYHCNSCSVDCSRKRYHCRTQADFDLCSDCYNDEKFDQGMSQLDFILMDSAEVPGSGDANWTDQETLLLLEAIEIFKGNQWDDIAEHVATKNKAQCMLYFLQMPILASLPDDDCSNQTSQKISVISVRDSAENGTEVLEQMEISNKVNATSEETGINFADKNVSAKLVAASHANELYKSSVTDPANKKISSDVNVSGEHESIPVIDVLRSAFEAVGNFPEKEGTCSFSETGNPVMALAAFFSGLVEHDDAVTSCRSSLRAILEISPALLLATRHCFILPDPPNELEIPTVSVSPLSTGEMHQNCGNVTPDANNTHKDTSKKVQGAMIIQKHNAASNTSLNEPQELSYTKGSSVDVPQADDESHRSKNADNPIPVVKNSGASERNSNGNIAADGDNIRRLQRAACTGISAAAVKAKLFADQEEYHILELADLVIQKQLQKIEAKMSLIAEAEHMAVRGKEITFEIQKNLLMEWTTIFFPQRLAEMRARLNQHGAPGTRPPVGYALNQHMSRP